MKEGLWCRDQFRYRAAILDEVRHLSDAEREEVLRFADRIQQKRDVDLPQLPLGLGPRELAEALIGRKS